MEFPFGHHSHKHRHQNTDEREDQERPYYPPPGTAGFAPPPPIDPENEFERPPPTRVTHVHHSSENPPPSYYPQGEFVRAPPYRQETEFERPPLTQVSHVHHSIERPPPQYYGENEFERPTPTQVTHVHHSGVRPEESGFPNYAPPPPSATHVAHVSHEVNQEFYEGTPISHTFKPHLPSVLHHQIHQPASGELGGKPTFKVFCKAEPDFSLTVREGKVILARSDPSDEFQHWYKDEKYSTRVKDEDGYPCFSLVNKATGQAIKHSTGDTHPVQLIPYNANVLDQSILWTESKDFGEGFRAIRMVNNIRLNMDAFHGDKRSGGVHDGTIIVLWQWHQGDNQLWKIRPYCKFLHY